MKMKKGIPLKMFKSDGTAAMTFVRLFMLNDENA